MIIDLKEKVYTEYLEDVKNYYNANDYIVINHSKNKVICILLEGNKVLEISDSIPLNITLDLKYYKELMDTDFILQIDKTKIILIDDNYLPKKIILKDNIEWS